MNTVIGIAIIIGIIHYLGGATILQSFRYILRGIILLVLIFLSISLLNNRGINIMDILASTVNHIGGWITKICSLSASV